jgi:hypothetical protein
MDDTAQGSGGGPPKSSSHFQTPLRDTIFMHEIDGCFNIDSVWYYEVVYSI